MDLGVLPHFNGSDGQKRGKSMVLQGWLLEKVAFAGKFDEFRGFAGLHYFRRLPRKTGVRFSVTKFYVQNVQFTLGRGRISGFPPFQRPEIRICGSPPISASPMDNWVFIFCYQILPIKCAIYILGRGRISGFSPISAAPMARTTENTSF